MTNLVLSLYMRLLTISKFLLGKKLAFQLHRRMLFRLPFKPAFRLTWSFLEVFPCDQELRQFYASGRLRHNNSRKLILNPDCLGSRFFSVSGFWEPDLTGSLQNQQQGLLVDVGANYGYFSALWLQLNRNNRVISVEPVTECLDLLSQNLPVTESDRVNIADVCIGAQDSESVYMEVGSQPQMLSKVIAMPTENARVMKMRSIKSLLAKFNEKRIDVLKVDAEGHD
jgi:FkbM family methyltransferase